MPQFVDPTGKIQEGLSQYNINEQLANIGTDLIPVAKHFNIPYNPTTGYSRGAVAEVVNQAGGLSAIQNLLRAGTVAYDPTAISDLARQGLDPRSAGFTPPPSILTPGGGTPPPSNIRPGETIEQLEARRATESYNQYLANRSSQPGYIAPPISYSPGESISAFTNRINQQASVAPISQSGAVSGQPRAYTGPSAVLQPGSTDVASVKKLQDYLVSQGLMTQAQVDTGYGIYGPKTTAAVLALQKKLGIDYSSGPGYFGPRTIAALQAQTPVVPSPPPLPPPASSPVVGTSAQPRAEQAKQKLEEVRRFAQEFLGAPPSVLDYFTEANQGELTAARAERNTLDTELVSIANERMTIADEFTKFKAQQVGLPAEGRTGAISERGRQLQEQMDSLNRRELVVETKLRNRNTVINELMSAQKQEYSAAIAQYDKAFSRSLQLYSVISGEEAELKQQASANLDIYANALGAQIKSGNITPDQITGIQIARMEEMEVQAGRPNGTTLAVLRTLRPDENILAQGLDERTGKAWVLVGNWSSPVRRSFQAETPKPLQRDKLSQSEVDRALRTAALSKASAELEGNKGTDGKYDPGIYKRLRADYVAVMGGSSDFDSVFSSGLSQREQVNLGLIKL